MLHNYFTSFLDYCKNAYFSERSIESLTFRLNEFSNFLKTVDSPSNQVIEYQQLTQFVADFNKPSASVKKSRVWALRQFFHFLKLNQIINENTALQIPYPKIDKKVPNFLTCTEFKLVLNHFSQKATNRIGFRNLVIISPATLGYSFAVKQSSGIPSVSKIRYRRRCHQNQQEKEKE